MKLPINELKPNKKNPRWIKDDSFEKLVKSIQDFPEMLEAREIVVNEDYVILGGNMRYQAALKAGITEVPVKVVDWPEEKQQEFIIKDNISGGEWDWDVLANEWDVELLRDWDLQLPNWHEVNEGELDNLDDFNDVLVSDDNYHLNITFEDEDKLKEFMGNNNIVLDKNYKRVGKTVSIKWPLKQRRDVKNVKFK